MDVGSARSLATDLLHFCSLHDGREYSEQEVNTWVSHLSRTGPNTPGDYRQAIEEYYARPDARRAGPGDIVTRATTIRRARTGMNRVPQLRKRGVPMPDDVRAKIRAIQNRTKENQS